MDSVKFDLWNGSVPVIFTLATSDVVGLSYPEPLVLMVPRFSILGCLFPTLCENFDQCAGLPAPTSSDMSTQPMSPASTGGNISLSTNYAGLDKIWLQGPNGEALKWWYPAGPILDTLLESASYSAKKQGDLVTARQLSNLCYPIRITIRYTARPNFLLPCTSLMSVRNQFLYSLKEAVTILYGSATAVLELPSTDIDKLITAMFNSDPLQWQITMQAVEKNASFREKKKKDREDQVRAAEKLLERQHVGRTESASFSRSDSKDGASGDLDSFLGSKSDVVSDNLTIDLDSQLEHPFASRDDFQNYDDTIDTSMYLPVVSSYLQTIYAYSTTFHSIPIRLFLVGCEHLFQYQGHPNIPPVVSTPVSESHSDDIATLSPAEVETISKRIQPFQPSKIRSCLPADGSPPNDIDLDKIPSYSQSNSSFPRLRTLRSLFADFFPQALIVEADRIEEALCDQQQREEESTSTPEENPTACPKTKRIQVLIEGVSVPLETPLAWLFANFKQIDGFLYVIARIVE